MEYRYVFVPILVQIESKSAQYVVTEITPPTLADCQLALNSWGLDQAVGESDPWNVLDERMRNM